MVPWCASQGSSYAAEFNNSSDGKEPIRNQESLVLMAPFLQINHLDPFFFLFQSFSHSLSLLLLHYNPPLFCTTMTSNTTLAPPHVRTPEGGASLMVAFQCQRKKMVVVGTNNIAANRVLALLESDAQVILVGDLSTMVPELLYRINHGQVEHVLQWQGDLLKACHLVFICQGGDDLADLVEQCRHSRVPVNVTDRNDLCDFFMTSTYRDQSLQIAISTNGQASKLANRIRRHVISGLPAKLGQAVQRMGLLRKKIRQADHCGGEANTRRRMAWLAQISEYWSLDRLAKLSDTDMGDLLESYREQQDEGYSSNGSSPPETPERKKVDLAQIDPHGSANGGQLGTITLVGSGPGDPNLLTLAAHQAIKDADLVLSDKIVPAEVVALVECELKIARKFPGNADAAQHEFNELALVALQQGKKVVRLKQGGKLERSYESHHHANGKLCFNRPLLIRSWW